MLLLSIAGAPLTHKISGAHDSIGKPENFSFLIRRRDVPHGSRKPLHGFHAYMKPKKP